MNSISNFQVQSGETMGEKSVNVQELVFVAGEEGADDHDNDGHSVQSDKSSSSEVAPTGSIRGTSRRGNISDRLDASLDNIGGGILDSMAFRGAMDPDGAHNQQNQSLESGGFSNQHSGLDATPIQRLGISLSTNVN